MSPEHGADRLVASPILHPGQALDCYLEHVAEANYLPAGTLMTTIAAATDTTRYLLLRPTPRTLEALSGLTGRTRDALNAATLAPLDGSLVDLAGLDPHSQPSYRAVAARGWAPGQGSQICPRCLAESGTWDIAWRLPTTTVCLRHQNYLLATCPGCQRPFRATRHTIVRPIGATVRCGNSLGRRGRYCQIDLTTLPTRPADPRCVDRQTKADPQTSPGRAPQILGDDRTTGQFVDDVKSLTALLLHIATATTRAELLPHWTRDVNAATHAQTRAPRWSIRPPDDIPTRSKALTAATEILTHPDLETALTHFTPWVQAVPPTSNGFLGWAPDHMTPTAATTRLVMAAHAPRRRLSRLLETSPPLTASIRHIPQLLPRELYEAHVADLFDSRAETIRLFASLSIARTHPDVTTWAAAAQAIDLPAHVGPRCAQAAAASQTASPAAVLAAISSAAKQLDGRDFRALEDQVRLLARSDEWFTPWARRHRPGTRATSQPLAVNWLWTHAAHAHPTSAPDTAPVRARRFAATLTPEQQTSLRRVFNQRGPERRVMTAVLTPSVDTHVAPTARLAVSSRFP